MQKKLDKILVIRLSSLGDIILTTPVLESLKKRFPQSQIYFLTKTRYRDLLVNDPRLSGLIEFDPQGRHKGLGGFKRMLDELKPYQFDLLIDLHANLRSFFIRHLSNSKIKIKYKKRWFPRWLMIHLKFFKTKPRQTVDSYLDVLKKIKVEDRDRTPVLFLGQDDIEFKEKFLLDSRIKKDDIVIGIHPGARWETKRWDVLKFGQVGQALIQKLGCKIILFGDSVEDKILKDIAGNLPASNGIEAMGLPLGKLASLIQRCDVLITNDSGPMHIAEALQVPVVAIFGPTHPQLGFAPIGQHNIVLSANVECSPCSLHGEGKCHKKMRLCMDLITADMVVEAVENQQKSMKPCERKLS
jgi:heptosyltransferase II